MARVELIRVRASSARLLEVADELREMVSLLGDTLEHAQVSLLGHALFDGDLAVVIKWSERVDRVKSREGTMVAAHLSRFGEVDHSVWIPFFTDEPQQLAGAATSQQNDEVLR